MSPETALPLQPPSAYEANRDIVFMTLPLLALSTYFYGARPAVLCLTAAFTAMLCDHLVAWLRHRPCDKTENSSIPSALVLVLLLPATVHYYVVVVSVAVAILLGKHAFGGYGHYPFNPAAFGYAVAAVSWPGEVFLYPVPFTTMSVLDTGSATVMESVSHTWIRSTSSSAIMRGPSAPLRCSSSWRAPCTCGCAGTSRWASLSAFCSPARWWRFFTRV